MSEQAFPPTTGLELVRWIGWAQRKAGEDWIRARELSHEQGFVLGYLVQNPGSIQRDVAAVSRTSAASVSSLLQGLERRGLVERRTEPGDAEEQVDDVVQDRHLEQAQQLGLGVVGGERQGVVIRGDAGDEAEHADEEEDDADDRGGLLDVGASGGRVGAVVGLGHEILLGK